ncbi:HAD family hydrolase [Sedimentibacter sp. zth1]|uniref:HAD family hydrolase n=1 Tax=Sedimentibacter sp. zth1 TaxID=2816908 RepID=UPI001A928A0C|nr:HAD family hydrolase [Sedimentibacter sp. zth1]QSX05805.1 HAD family hydrolase [Sedimentibacter sp. zth1]
MKYKAIFFDRDNTLLYFNPEKFRWRNEKIKEWTGNDYNLSYDKMIEIFSRAGYPAGGIKSIEQEKLIFRNFYNELLKEFGVKNNMDEKSKILFDELWCNNNSLLFEEVVEILEYFKQRGYKLGVISDTSPSLQLTIEQAGISKYFDSYTCSDLVGVSKPDPLIYNTALKTLDVKAEESIYVDDYDVEADGARNLGFLSFHIDRSGKKETEWDIKSLKEIIYYLEEHTN